MAEPTTGGSLRCRRGSAGYGGAVLARWPNRVVNGRYQFAGAAHQLALTEPERGHALHGLAGWQDFEVVSREPHTVALG